MPTFTKTELEKAAQVLQKTKHSYYVEQKLKDLFPGFSEEKLAELLWCVFLDGYAEMDDDYLGLLRPSPARDAAALLTVLKQLMKAYPNGQKRGSNYTTQLWDNEEDLPGYVHNISYFLEQQTEKVQAELAKKTKELPAPYDQGMLLSLVGLGVLKADALPKKMLSEAAARWLKKEQSTWPWGERCPWSEEELSRALCEASQKKDAVIKSGGALRPLSLHASDEELVQAAMKITFGSHIEADWDVLIARGATLLPLLEKGLLSCKGKVNFVNMYEQPSPWMLLIVPYLKLCQQEKKEPPASLDPVLSEIMQKYSPAWYGGGEDELQARWLSAWRSLPQPRLIKLLEGLKEFPWYLFGAAPTPSLCKRLLSEIAKLPAARYSSDLRPQRRALQDGGAALLPFLLEEMKKKTPHKSMFVEAIVAHAKDEAFTSAIVGLLYDSGKLVRDRAVSVMPQLPQEKLLALLKEPLTAKSKEVRLSAAAALATLLPSKETIALAKELHDKESLAEIKKILAQVKDTPLEEEAPPKPSFNADPALIEALKEALEKNIEPRWKDLAERGPALLPAYWEAFCEEWNGWNLVLEDQEWYALLCHFSKSPEVLPWVERTVLACNKYDFAGFAEAVLPEIPALVGIVAKLLVKGRLQEPAKKEHSHFGEEEAISWLASQGSKDAVEAFVWGISQSAASIVKDSTKALLSLGEEGQRRLLSGFSSLPLKSRQKIVAMLEETPPMQALSSLEAAVKAESNAPLKASLTKILEVVKASNIDVSSFSDDAKGHKALDKALSDFQMAMPSTLPKKQPKLVWKSGADLSEGAQSWFLSLLVQESKSQQNPALSRVRGLLQDDSAYSLSASLAKTLGTERGAGLYMLSVIGSPSQMEDLGAALEEHASSQRTGWGEDGVEVMVRTNSDIAVRWLDHWHRKTKKNALRWRAEAGLTRLAKKRGVDREEMIDATTPHFGFTRDGERSLDYGGRTITAHLDLKDGLYFTDEKGKRSDSLPAAKKGDDAAKVSAIKEELKGLKQRINQLVKSQTERLESALSNGRRYSFDVFKARFLAHPLMFPMTKRLLFMHELAGVRTPFAVLADGSLCDAQQKSLTLKEAGEVQLLHPVWLSKEEKARWEGFLSSQKIEPPFEQLGRAVFVASELPKNIAELLLALPKCATGRFVQAVNRLRYEMGPREDAGIIYTVHRTRGDYVVTLRTSGISLEAMDALPEVELEEISIYKTQEKVELLQLPALVLSETIRDIRLLMGETL